VVNTTLTIWNILKKNNPARRVMVERLLEIRINKRLIVQIAQSQMVLAPRAKILQGMQKEVLPLY